MAHQRIHGALWGLGGVVVLGLLLAPLWMSAGKPPPPSDQPLPTPIPTEPPHETNALESADGEDGETLFRLIVAEQEKNLAKIHSIKFTYTQSRKQFTPGRERQTESERIIVRKGDNAWTELRFKYLDPKVGHWQDQDKVSRIVWNRKYLASWPSVKRKAAYLWEYDSPESMPERVKIEKASAAAFPERRWAFGYGTHSLADLLADPDKYRNRYEVLRTGTETDALYEIKIWPAVDRPEDRKPYPGLSLTVDPAKGFMVIHKVGLDVSTGNIGTEYRITPREVAPGVWFPERIEEFVYRQPDEETATRPTDMVTVQALSNIEVNSDIPDSQFTWQALGITRDVDVVRASALGVVEMMRPVNDELIPS